MKHIKYLGLLILLLVVSVSCFNTITSVEDKDLDQDIFEYASSGDLAGVKECIENGVDINFNHGINGTVLMVASRNGHLEVVKYLVDSGANIDFSSSTLGSALNAASEGKHTKIVEYLASKNASFNYPLIRASYVGDIYLVKYLVDKDPSIINFQDSGKDTALIHASLGGYLEIVKYLVGIKDVDVNVQNNYKSTALMWGAFGGYLEIVECLVGENANIDLTDNNNETALMIAIRHKHDDVVTYLQGL